MQHYAFFYVSIIISMKQREIYADFSELTTTHFLHYVDHLKFQNGRHTRVVLNFGLGTDVRPEVSTTTL